MADFISRLRRAGALGKKAQALRAGMQLTSHIVVQQPGQPLGDILEAVRAQNPDRLEGRAGRLVHIVNPFAPPGKRTLDETQRLTFATMEQAARCGGMPIVQAVAVTPEDRDLAPASFVRGDDLDRSVLDIRSFEVPRPLPLLFDILDRGAALAKPDDYLIYTNVDICLMPLFYVAVRDLIGLGFDAITVNRRTISDAVEYRRLPALAAAEVGADHGGFDCLVFRRALYDSFVRCDVCIGAPPVARALLYNLVAHSRRMLMLKHVHMTYHLGDDRPWGAKSVEDYAQFNIGEVAAMLATLARDPAKRSRLLEFCERHPEPDVLTAAVRDAGAAR